MPGGYSLVKTVVAGDTILASDRNAEHQNHINKLEPQYIDDYSANTTAMQATTDPYPGSVESLATSLQGELERIRYVIKQISGNAQWYYPASVVSFPSGTKIPFYQSTVPTGWTAVTLNDFFLRVVTTGTTGGTNTAASSPASGVSVAHTHTVASHTHGLANHTHTGGAHVHAMSNTGWGATQASNTSGRLMTSNGSGNQTGTAAEATAGINSDSAGTVTSGVPSINASDAATPATDSQLSTVKFNYADVVIGSKN